MEKKQYDAIIEVLSQTGCCEDLVLALTNTTGFGLCQQVEQLQDECTKLAKQFLHERNQAEVVRNDLAATYKTITELRGQVAELEAELKTASKSAASLIIQLQEARAELFDLYHQECYSGPVDGIAKYDNQCMSCYEYAEDKLIEWGLLKPEQCLRRFPAHDEKEKK